MILWLFEPDVARDDLGVGFSELVSSYWHALLPAPIDSYGLIATANWKAEDTITRA